MKGSSLWTMIPFTESMHFNLERSDLSSLKGTENTRKNANHTVYSHILKHDAEIKHFLNQPF